jgi:hypothetical protein
MLGIPFRPGCESKQQLKSWSRFNNLINEFLMYLIKIVELDVD